MHPCERATRTWRGVRIAADYKYTIELEGEGNVGYFYTSPDLIEEATLGFLYYREKVKSDISLIDLVKVNELEYLVKVSRKDRPLEIPRWLEDPLEWNLAMDLLGRLSELVPKKDCPYAFHSMALFLLKGGKISSKMSLVDVSRHTGMVKILGWILRKGSSLSGYTPVLVTTGRVSSDLVSMMDSVNLRIVLSPRHALMSGVISAYSRGITLVSKDLTRRLKVFTHPNRIRNAPVVEWKEKGGGIGHERDRRRNLPIC